MLTKKESRNNGNKEVEHPKTTLEFLENSLSAAMDFSSAERLTLDQSLAVLIFNELRCIHYHFDEEKEIRDKEIKEKEKIK